MAEVKVVKPDQRDASTAQTPGMLRAEGCGGSTVGAQHIWVGHVTVNEGVRSGPHHHGDVESVIYVVSGKARFRFGENLEHSVDAEPGDFVFVPPHLVHQEVNASDEQPVLAVVARSSLENVVVNVDLPAEVADA